ncbi:NUDIX domain-containing protein [Nocardioides zeae]|uniref:NUDIX domain-containing protein n=1 Tax=Nocardioides imazamoxiresistens TaxID=3231893 RepID=A0ABU3PYI9_9ACTN|nr:NUDIX domain-containing protein [Nocardioides zeae]MDT9593946.1 NUDIX domain-containing protein [Nocardioides zeae]
MFHSDFPIFYLTVDVVLFAQRDGELAVLVVERGEEPYAGSWALPGGFVGDGEELVDAARRELVEETGIDGEGLALEQLRTFGAPDRDRRPHRVVSVAHLAVTRHAEAPTAGTDARAAVWLPVDEVAGRLAFDHDEILAHARERVASKIEYTQLAASFLPPEFTLAQLRGVYEAVWGHPIDPGNFQRKLRAAPDFLESTGASVKPAGGRGRPAEVFRACGRPFDRIGSPVLRSAM